MDTKVIALLKEIALQLIIANLMREDECRSFGDAYVHAEKIIKGISG